LLVAERLLLYVVLYARMLSNQAYVWQHLNVKTAFVKSCFASGAGFTYNPRCTIAAVIFRFFTPRLMDQSALLKLVNEMLLAISALSAYELPATLPAVEVLRTGELQHMACARPCRVRALYLPERGVLLADDLNFDEAHARSVLLHELVHHMQHVNGKFTEIADECERSYQAELEAYNVQNAYLKRHGQDIRFVIGQLPNMCAGEKRSAKPWMEPSETGAVNSKGK
jgi:hypothetical protein